MYELARPTGESSKHLFYLDSKAYETYIAYKQVFMS
jgi:hypothetical protein